MSFIHQIPAWPEFTWDIETLATALAALRNEQGRHLGRMESLDLDLQAEASLEVLTIDVVKSWAIEGDALPREEVRSSIARHLGLDVAGLRRSSREVDGVVEMMLDATQRFEDPLTPERLFRWHAALFPTGHSGLGRITVGAWRPEEAGPMQVVSGPLGREFVHFEAPVADRLESEMDSFLCWFNAPVRIDPTLRAGVAHLWFITIHPFEDGNGRIARAIGDMALARSDRTKNRFYSMSGQIEAERSDYYLQLETAQRGDLDITEWLRWFLGSLDRSIRSADVALGAVLHKAKIWRRINASAVSDRQRLVLVRLLGDFEGYLTTSKYAQLAKCSPDTALRDIRELLESGILAKNAGGGRSTSYRVAEPQA